MPDLPVKNTHILVVNDESRLLDSQRGFLERAGFICFTATSAREALDVLSQEEIALAVIDVEMPGISGADLFAAIKEKYPWTGVVLVSDDERRDAAVAQIKAGALDYLVKPVEGSALVLAVRDALERRGSHLERIGDLQHLEELIAHQSKALDNKAQEIRSLTRELESSP